MNNIFFLIFIKMSDPVEEVPPPVAEPAPEVEGEGEEVAAAEEEPVVVVKPAWISDEIRFDLVKDFTAELGSVDASVHDFDEAYQKICTKYEIIPCPFVKVTSFEGEEKTLRLLHCDIDISNWRAICMALVCTEPPVTEIVLHGSRLSGEHLSNLKVALDKKRNTCTVLKMTNVVFVGTKYAEALSSLTNCGAVYISLRNCNLGSEFITAFLEHSTGNTNLQFLDLSGNNISDADVEKLFDNLYFNVALKYINLRKNALTGTCLPALGRLLTGRVSTPEDQTTLKVAQKPIADKNKVIKEGAKARKAAGLPDIHELATAESRIFKVGTEMMTCNRGITQIGLNQNPLLYELINAFAEYVAEHEAHVAADKVNGHCETEISIKDIQIPVLEDTDGLAAAMGVLPPPPATAPYSVAPTTLQLIEAEKKSIRAHDLGKGIVISL